MTPATRHPRRWLATTLGLLSLAAAPAAPAALLDWNAGSGDWYDASHWTPAQVPTAFDTATINNAGAATIAAGTPTNIANLLIGAGSGTVAGTLNSASDVGSGSTISTGTLSGGVGHTATGQVSVDNASVAGAVRVGVLSTSDAASSASGTLAITGGNLAITQAFGLDVGRTVNTEGVATGTVLVDGTLSVSTAPFASTMSVGVSGGGSAIGSLSAAAIDTSASALGDVGVGVSAALSNPGASAVGQLQLGAGQLDTSGDVGIGTALGNAGGFAVGEALMTDVGLQAVGSGTQWLQVGTVTATGLLDNLGQGSASGTASVHQVAGFDLVSVGSAVGTHLNGLDATGALSVGPGGLQGNASGTSALDVGVAGGAPNNNQIFGLDASAIGHLESTGGLGGFASVQVGVNGLGAFSSTGAGSAQGSLSVSGGDTTIGQTLGIGVAMLRIQTTINDNTGADISADGTADISGGTLSVGSGGRIAVGQVSVNDLSADPAINATVASGSLTLTDVNVQAAGADLNVGFALGGFGTIVTHTAAGSLSATGGQITVDDVRVGVGSGEHGQATGSLSLDGTDLGAQSLTIGAGSGSHGTVSMRDASASIAADLNVGAVNAFGGAPMSGALTLDQATMSVGGNAFIGPVYQGGTGALTLIDADLDIAGNLYLGRSSNAQTLFGDANVWLERSTLTVGDDIVFDIGASLSVLIFGTDRGTGYGAIDTGAAALDGRLRLDLGGASAMAGDTFDLIVSAGLGQITGDFIGVDVLGLGAGLVAQFGVVTDVINGQQVDIYRLSLAAQTVPEPASLALSALALLLLAGARRRMANRRPVPSTGARAHPQCSRSFPSGHPGR